MERRRVVALSPLVGGRAVKAPLAEMIRALAGEEASPGAIVRHYRGLLAGIFVEAGDEASVTGCAVRGGQTVMTDRAESLRLAREILDFAAGLA
jgi:LPPG:FO 2-phospho-L-lactate transferase